MKTTPIIEEYNDDVNNTPSLQDSGIDSLKNEVVVISDDDDESSDSGSDATDAVAVRDEAAALPRIGNVSIQNSTDVHFGNKTVYHGPVTIKQIVYPTGGAKLGIEGADRGVDNAAFEDCGVGEGAKEEVGVETVVGEVRVGKGYKWLRKLPLRRPIEIVIFLSVVLLSLVILLIVLLWRHPNVANGQNVSYKPEEGESYSPIHYDPDLGNNSLSGKLRIVSRLEWVAQPALDKLNVLKTPVPYVIIQHTATENCTSQAQCVFQVRYIQMFHIESRNFDDIGYNFLVGGDGAAYEGRGWEAEGAHTYSWNSRSIGIAFIGTFMKIRPPEIQIDACKRLIAKGVEMGYISKDYKLLAARQLQGTESPGKVLFEDMKTWPHWSETP